MIALGLDSAIFKYSLSEVHFDTGRLLFEFNGRQYHLQLCIPVFVAFANPVSGHLGKRSATPETQHCQLLTTHPTVADIGLLLHCTSPWYVPT